MPAQANANVVALQLEKVRDKVPLLYERDDILLTMIQQRGDVEKVSSRNMRLPLQVNPGGKAGSYNADGGDLGRGSGTAYDVAQVSPIFFRFAIEITKLVEYATTGRERAIENATKREVANGMKQFRAFLDKLMQTAGNGVLGTISSFASTTWTMATPPGAALVYVGQTIQVYDSTLTTNRGTANVTAADPISPTQTITVDVNPAGLTNGDVLVHDGLSGAQPVSLFGIKYHQNNATTGAWLNLNRATYPVQLATPSVNADQTRVDFLDLSHWGRAVLKDIDFYEVNGNTVFPIYGASGGLAASYIFYFDTAFQVWDDSPRTGAFIDTLARPSGY